MLANLQCITALVGTKVLNIPPEVVCETLHRALPTGPCGDGLSLQIALRENGSGKLESHYEFFAGPELGHHEAWAVLDVSKVKTENGRVVAVEECVRAPLDAMYYEPLGEYAVYAHVVSGRTYYGITKQTWPIRFQQHLSDARNGSPYLFHKALRDCAFHADFHMVRGFGLTYERAMAIEEHLVGLGGLFPKGLNMIPGGFAGIRHLHERGLQGVSPRRWEHRGGLIRELSKLGYDNPLLSARWQDAAYASSVICNNPNNFDANTVADIRLRKAVGHKPEKIAADLSVRPERISRLLSGQTYARV